MPAPLPILDCNEAPRPRRVSTERPSISFDFTRVARNWRWGRSHSDSREIILDEYSAMIDGELPPRRREVPRGIHGRLQVEPDQFRRIIAPGERILGLSQCDDRAIAKPRTVSLHFWCPSKIARGLGPVDFVPAVFLRPCTRDCGEIPWELEVDRFRQQRADV